MFSVRLSKRECTDTDKIELFLSGAQTGFLGLSDGRLPYVVPLNFVKVGDSFYFHGAGEGRKLDMIRSNNEGCFTISEAYGTITDPVPAHTDTAYMSVMAFGRIEEVADLDEATGAMQAMLDKYVPGYYGEPLAKAHLDKYRSSMDSATAVFKLVARQITAKENEPVPGRMHEGRGQA
ncbi:pyridoxamine 5'-phosphate oxidase family protein [Paenibacillus arenilitoris]|uniref:Pyridoxamine 5'-phosphate oxidase family protein n=1 Tax=Paenibacillus arenilitoris TaxID=2772299 RepID=A0A927H649_9BACL|nr:pyridoxamine 5'-phosphate oxidase family protein [Paenibacillus arenilitoris]MBD2870166.1 pyridoxamine 5'-phosphate oxidase family protein [Paenibacillus arenilitoris]